LLFIFLTIRFFVIKKLRQRLQIIQKTEFLVYSLFFVIIIAFIAGYTSILFGLLVRIRAPLIPFFVLLLMVKTEKKGLKIKEL
jgi:hypothetical protein